MKKFGRSKKLVLGLVVILGVFLMGITSKGSEKETGWVMNPEGKIKIVEIVDLAGEESVLAEEARKILVEQYGDDLSWEVRQAPLVVNEDSLELAILAERMGHEGKFFEFKEKLADGFGLWSRVGNPKELWMNWVDELLSEDKLKLSKGIAKQKVLEDIEWAEQWKVSSLPAYVVNGELVGLKGLKLAVIESVSGNYL